jgi:hypothetical protein
MTKVAVALFHGIGSPEPTFAESMVQHLRSGTVPPEFDVVCQRIHWGPVLQDQQDELSRRINQDANLKWRGLRDFVIDSLGDAVSYHPTTSNRETYDTLHLRVAEQLFELGEAVGHDTPLCVVAHSFGSVIASNYFYDLQQHERSEPPKPFLSSALRAQVQTSPLAQGKTLAMFVTLGSPLALWSMRHGDFDKPINVPSWAFRARFPQIEGAWLNFYDANDVFAYPLGQLNQTYANLVADVPVSVGGLLTGWNPLSHCRYWRDRNVIQSVAVAVRDLGRQIAASEKAAEDPVDAEQFANFSVPAG